MVVMKVVKKSAAKGLWNSRSSSGTRTQPGEDEENLYLDS